MSETTFKEDLIRFSACCINDGSGFFSMFTKHTPNEILSKLRGAGIQALVEEIDIDCIKVNILDFDINRAEESGLLKYLQ